MGLNTAIARLAARHAHVLLVEIPGEWRLRVEAERVALRLGLRLADSPSDADIMIVCGRVGQQMAQAVDLAWEQLPGPRARVDLVPGEDVRSRISQATTLLADTTHQHRDASHRDEITDLLEKAEDHDHSGGADDAHTDHGDMDHGDMDHGDMAHGDMDHGDMDHGDMEMAPGGLALAEGGPDRDGLEMDVLHLALGPVLSHWAAGLVVRCSLQGDVIVGAHAELLDTRPEPRTSPMRARRLDDVASLLALAGWEDAVARARMVRDALLDDDPDAEISLARLDRQIRRSRILRWSLRGLGTSAGLDAYDRLIGTLQRAHGDEEVDLFGPATPEELAELITGVDLAAARLIVASLDLQRLRASDTEQRATHA